MDYGLEKARVSATEWIKTSCRLPGVKSWTINQIGGNKVAEKWMNLKFLGIII